MDKCKNLTLFKKSTKVYELIFKDEGVAKDISGWAIYFTVKQNMKDNDSVAKIKKKITFHQDPTNGKTLIELLKSDTDLDVGNYYYSIDYKDDEGNEDVLFWGRIHLRDPVIDDRT